MYTYYALKKNPQDNTVVVLETVRANSKAEISSQMATKYMSIITSGTHQLVVITAKAFREYYADKVVEEEPEQAQPEIAEEPKQEPEKQVRTFADIEQKFSDKVAEYMAQGYRINVGTMGGSQGEIGKVDLTNGQETIRIMIDNEHGKWDDWYNDRVVMIVGRATEVTPDIMGSTIWNNRLEIIEKQVWINARRGNAVAGWYMTEEEAQVANEKRTERFYRTLPEKDADLTENQKVKELLIKAVRRQPGMKSARLCEVTKITKRRTDKGTEYVVALRNKTLKFKAA